MTSTRETEGEMRGFNIETAEQDFGGPGREVICPSLRPGESLDGPHAPRRMRLIANGWTFSVIWGYGTYCTGARIGVAEYLDHPPLESPDAEVGVWKGDGEFIELHGDKVEGWVSPASFLAAVEAAERDDEDGIRAALVRSES